jgi:hypothetical protein
MLGEFRPFHVYDARNGDHVGVVNQFSPRDAIKYASFLHNISECDIIVSETPMEPAVLALAIKH